MSDWLKQIIKQPPGDPGEPVAVLVPPDTLLLNVDKGPGFAELWSPNMGVRWRINGPEGGFVQPTYLETGPASRAAVYFGRQGGSIKVESVQFEIPAARRVRQQDGRIVATPGGAPDARRIAARFYPATVNGDDPCEKAHEWGPIIAPDGYTIQDSIAGLQTEAIAYPPQYRNIAQIYASRPIQVEVRYGAILGGITKFVSAPSTAHTINVSRQCFLVIQTAGGPPTEYVLEWRKFDAVRSI